MEVTVSPFLLHVEYMSIHCCCCCCCCC
jgi:hypothetical protein